MFGVSIILPSEMSQAERNHQRNQRSAVDLVLLEMCEEDEKGNGKHKDILVLFCFGETSIFFWL